MATTKQRPLSGPEKAVVVLLSIDEQIASEIVKNLSEPDLAKMSNYVNLLSDVPREIVDRAKQEFVQTLAENIGGIAGSGREQMKQLLRSALPQDKVGEILEQLETGEASIGLETLRWLDAPTIARFIRNEHPQTIALILAHLDPPQAASVLKQLDERIQPDVAMRMANLEQISPEVVRELNEILAKELNATGAAHNAAVGGVEHVAEIVNQLDRSTETKILGKIEELNPELAEQIRELMFTFDDLVKIDQRGMQNILKEVSNDILTLALKTASDEIKEKIFSSISERAATMIKEELEFMGPVKLSDVERAQQEIVKIARRLEEEGKIVIAGRGGGETLV